MLPNVYLGFTQENILALFNKKNKYIWQVPLTTVMYNPVVLMYTLCFHKFIYLYELFYSMYAGILSRPYFLIWVARKLFTT